MKIIRTFDNQFIKVDPQPTESGYVWGQRWNRNTQDWGLCMLYNAINAVEVREADLLKALDKID